MRLLANANFGFDAKGDVNASLASLERILDGKSKWFADLLQKIYVERTKFTFTDVFLTEGRPIGVAKPYMIFPFFVDGHPKLPTGDEIISIVEKFLGVREEDILQMLRERAGSVDFSFSVFGLGSFRCNFSIASSGMRLAMRILPFNIPALESEMNMPAEYVSFIKSLIVSKKGIMNPFENTPMEISLVRRGGLILHVGATGQGKSTAMASEVDFFATRINGTILTYENPIEYRFTMTKAPVEQYDIDIHFSGSFEGVLKHLLRNTPSIAMVGEVRSLKEMDALIDIASRGHLIFATMHASTVEEALEILLTLEHRRGQLANSLLAIVAHRLKSLYREEESKYKLIPFYETLIPYYSSTIKGYIKENKLSEISKLLSDKKQKTNFYIPFQVYLLELVQNGIINMNEKVELEALI